VAVAEHLVQPKVVVGVRAAAPARHLPVHRRPPINSRPVP
jgi:hypothetical protein